MKKILVMPDSFKGTMSSKDVCCLISKCIIELSPETEVSAIPIADGGEGTVDCFLSALKGDLVKIKTRGPYFEEIEASYGMIGSTAIIEMASVAGLTKVAENKLDPSETTTFGIGLLIADAIHRGCDSILLGIGGSCTNDAGAGAAAALGTVFFNSEGKTFIPVGKNLSEIAGIDNSKTEEVLRNCKITVICDVDNPLHGPNGAAFVFAPQKGADPEMTVFLDEQLKCFARTVEATMGQDINSLKGAGAAGGMGAGAHLFFDADMKSGIDAVLDTIDFEAKAEDCDLIITGEGKFDSQSLGGKVIIGISRRAKRLNVPVIAIVGQIDGDPEPAYEEGITAMFSTNTKAQDFEISRAYCRENLVTVTKNILKLLAIKTSGEKL